MGSEQLVLESTDTKFCLFCYKVQHPGNFQRNSTGFKDFLVFSQRYLETPETMNLNGIVLNTTNAESSGSSQSVIDTCETCLTIADEFNELYHEMKCVELKLQYKISTLSSIMREAGRVNSRRILLKQAMGEKQFSELNNRRREWIQHCFQRRCQYYPRVNLTNISTKKSEIEETTPPVEDESLCREWLISLGAVVLLLSGPPVTSNLIRYEALELDVDMEMSESSVEREAVQKTEPCESILEESTGKNSESLPEEEEESSSSCNSEKEELEEDPGPGETQVIRKKMCEIPGQLLGEGNELKNETTPVKDGREEEREPSVGHKTEHDESPMEVSSGEQSDNESDGERKCRVDSENEEQTGEDADFPMDTEFSTATKKVYNLRKRSMKQTADIVSYESEESDQEEIAYGGTSSSSEVTDGESNSAEVKNKPFASTSTCSNPKTNGPKILIKKTGDYYCCDLKGCEFQCLREEALHSHLKLHKPGSFKCTKCDLSLESPMELCMHEISHSKDEIPSDSQDTYVCQRCPFRTSHQTPYAIHFAVVHLNISGISTFGTNTCAICKLEIKFPKTHFRKTHNPRFAKNRRVQTCPEGTCKAVFTLRSAFLRHLHEHHRIVGKIILGSPALRCITCDLQFQSSYALVTHRTQVHNKVPCPLGQCGRTYATEQDAEAHATLHGSFKCTKCNFTTGYTPDYINHEIDCLHLINAEGLHSCPECKFTSLARTNIVDHRLEAHLGLTLKTFKCETCKLGFKRSPERDNHFMIYHKRSQDRRKKSASKIPKYFEYIKRHKEYSRKAQSSTEEKRKNFCAMCAEQFGTSKGFENHSKLHGKWTCQFCPVEKEFAPDLALHEIQKHKDNHSGPSRPGGAVKCPRCRWSTKFSKEIYSLRFVKHFLSEHLLLDTGVYACKLCEEGFLAKSEVSRHMTNFHRGKGIRKGLKFKCTECSAFFNRPLQVAKHKRNVHKIGEVDLTCKQCDKRFLSKLTLECHFAMVHEPTESKPFPCERTKCGMSFDSHDELILHQSWRCEINIKLKEQQSEVICQICGRTYKGENALKMHMKVHDPERPAEFKCDICSKSFKTKVQLQTHQEYHKDPSEWKFMCAVCSKKCTSKCKLRDHMRRHTKEKPFVCHVCGAKYTQTRDLRNHIKRNHKGVEFPKARNVSLRPGVSRKGKKLEGINYCFTREKDLQDASTE